MGLFIPKPHTFHSSKRMHATDQIAELCLAEMWHSIYPVEKVYVGLIGECTRIRTVIPTKSWDYQSGMSRTSIVRKMWKGIRTTKDPKGYIREQWGFINPLEVQVELLDITKSGNYDNKATRSGIVIYFRLRISRTELENKI